MTVIEEKKGLISRLMDIFKGKPAEKPPEEEVEMIPVEKVEEEPEKPEFPREAINELSGLRGLGSRKAEKLLAAGIDSVKNLAGCTSKDLAERVGISQNTASRWIRKAKEALSKK